MLKFALSTIYLIGASTLLFSCGSSSRSTEVQPEPIIPETEYCVLRATFQNPVTVSANAYFHYRPTNLSSGLNGNPLSRGIPYSEIQVTDSAGNIIQCSETGSDGQITLSLPKNGSFTLKVLSRANNNYIKASILEEIQKNKPYSISKTFTTNNSDSLNIGDLNAYARQSESAQIEGGAFNILWAIYKANQIMKSSSGNSDFVGEKVTVYWKAGFNPYSYFGYPDSLVSFYKVGERKLFILGGKDGDVKTQDTDHFDNSVIIHEYAHFLEDVYGRSDSPGGYHDGLFQIDARLAWSEGWANFYQSLILDNQYYIDTYGFSGDTIETGNSGGMGIIFDLNQNASTAYYGKLTSDGEGTYHEVSVSRGLYKAIKTAALPFQYIWETFASAEQGFRSPNFHFRNVGLFNKLLEQTLTRNSVSIGDRATVGTISYWKENIIGNCENTIPCPNSEKQSTTTKYYGSLLIPNSSNCTTVTSISPKEDMNLGEDDNGVPVTISDKVKSNKFYQFYHDGSDYTLELIYTNSGSKVIDLDLIIYNEIHSIVEDYFFNIGKTNPTIAGQSRRLNPAIENGFESISMNGKPAGWYLINVKANTYSSTNPYFKPNSELNGTASFILKTSTGSNLCPESN